MNHDELTASDVKRLAGATFHVKNLDGGTPVAFTIAKFESGWPRNGAEAYGVLATCHHPTRGDVASFVKLFKKDVPERSQRTAFLVRFGLARHHQWLFRGVPYAVLPRTVIAGVTVSGHIAQRIPVTSGGLSEDVYRLRDTGRWTFDETERRRFAGELCVAVEALERLGLAHGDLSSRNLMLGARPDGSPGAMLCDFDGFFHSAQPPLPISVRTFGTPGFISPEMTQTLSTGGLDPVVRSDRFALAALVCELMIWSDADAQRLTRGELLCEKTIAGRDADAIPEDIRARWEAGIDLLQQALRAPTSKEMPSPWDWLHCLGVRLSPPPPPVDSYFANTPEVIVRKAHGNRRSDVARTRLKSATGNFAPVSSELAEVEYHRSGGELILQMRWAAPVILLRSDRTYHFPDSPVSLPVQPRDRVLSNQFEFEFV